jgi:hypothetical protein
MDPSPRGVPGSEVADQAAKKAAGSHAEPPPEPSTPRFSWRLRRPPFARRCEVWGKGLGNHQARKGALPIRHAAQQGHTGHADRDAPRDQLHGHTDAHRQDQPRCIPPQHRQGRHQRMPMRPRGNSGPCRPPYSNMHSRRAITSRQKQRRARKGLTGFYAEQLGRRSVGEFPHSCGRESTSAQPSGFCRTVLSRSQKWTLQCEEAIDGYFCIVAAEEHISRRRASHR